MKWLVLLAFVTGFCLLPGVAPAQSKARAPLLVDSLKRDIRAMAVLNDKVVPRLDNRVLVVTFFASWCPPCRPEFAQLNRLRRQFSPNDVVILAINLFEAAFDDPGGVRMQGFLFQAKPVFSVLRGANDEKVTQLFGGVDRIPTVFIYDRRGQPVFSFIHQTGAAKMHATAKDLAPHVRRALAAVR